MPWAAMTVLDRISLALMPQLLTVFEFYSWGHRISAGREAVDGTVLELIEGERSHRHA